MTRPRAVIWAAVSTKVQSKYEKYSLPDQIKQAKEFCEREGFEVIEVLEVPGHSRRATDIHEVAAAMRKKNITAFDRLLKLWSEKGFDVFICRGADRFGRSQSLVSRVVEDTIGIGARIYSMQDGWIDRQNFRMFIAMAGYSAAHDIDGLVEKRRKGMLERLNKGLPPGEPPMSHKVVYDQFTGKAIKTIVDETKRPMFMALAKVLLDAVSWDEAETKLAEMGFTHPLTGKAYATGTMYQAVYNPFFWGNAALNYKAGRSGSWVWDPDSPAPEGTLVKYGTHESIYTGELAAQVQAELNRRQDFMKGKARPKGHAFTGLLVCGECFSRMAVQSGPRVKTVAWSCPVRNRVFCNNRKRVPGRIVKTYLNSLLILLLAADDPDLLLADATGADGEYSELNTRDRLQALKSEEAEIKRQIAALIASRATTASDDPFILQEFQRQITAASNRRKAIEKEITDITQKLETPAERQGRIEGLQYIAETGLEKFWQLPEFQINRILRSVLGDIRLVGLSGKITRRIRLARRNHP